jgi:hypothetical protein
MKLPKLNVSTIGKIAAALPIIAAAILCLMLLSVSDKTHTDGYVRDNVVQLVSEEGSCSGIRIKTPSNKTFVLTAAHCLPLAYVLPDPTSSPFAALLSAPTLIINAQSLGGSKVEFLKVVKVDVSVDLMLLEAPNAGGIAIGSSLADHEKVHTVTHGAGAPQYRTDGEVIKETMVFAGELFFVKTLCTAKILPGSSGGALLNDRNELVGIATHGDGTDFFSYFATLSQIKAFIGDK